MTRSARAITIPVTHAAMQEKTGLVGSVPVQTGVRESRLLSPVCWCRLRDQRGWADFPHKSACARSGHLGQRRRGVLERYAFAKGPKSNRRLRARCRTSAHDGMEFIVVEFMTLSGKLTTVIFLVARFGFLPCCCFQSGMCLLSNTNPKCRQPCVSCLTDATLMRKVKPSILAVSRRCGGWANIPAAL
jgi:hypothetical protein